MDVYDGLTRAAMANMIHKFAEETVAECEQARPKEGDIITLVGGPLEGLKTRFSNGRWDWVWPAS